MKMAMTTQKLVVLVVLVCIALGTYLFAFFSVRSVASESAELATELAYQNDRNKRLGSVEIVVRDTEEERALLREHFISQDDIVFFITTVEELGDSIGLVVDVVSVTERSPEGPGQSGELELTIAFSGTWDLITRMISLLELHAFANTLTDVRLRASANEEGGVLWSASATLVSVLIDSSE